MMARGMLISVDEYTTVDRYAVLETVQPALVRQDLTAWPIALQLPDCLMMMLQRLKKVLRDVVLGLRHPSRYAAASWLPVIIHHAPSGGSNPDLPAKAIQIGGSFSGVIPNLIEASSPANSRSSTRL